MATRRDADERLVVGFDGFIEDPVDAALKAKMILIGNVMQFSVSV
jgi:hypothetical protein